MNYNLYCNGEEILHIRPLLIGNHTITLQRGRTSFDIEVRNGVCINSDIEIEECDSEILSCMGFDPEGIY